MELPYNLLPASFGGIPMVIRFPPRIATLLLAIWLVVTGALTLLDVGNPLVHSLNAGLAVAAGVFVFLER